MQIWLDSLSYPTRIHNRYTSYLVKILRDEYTHLECSSDDHNDRLYFNAVYSGLQEGDGDCGYPPPPWDSHDYHTQTYISLAQELTFGLANHHLQLSPTLYIQPCDTSHWLISNPTDAGNIAVIDEEAFAFLSNFRTPTTVQQLVATQDFSMTHSLSAVQVCLALGFLHDLDQIPEILPKQSAESTLAAWLHITNACNLSCHYCYISKTADHMEQETSRCAVDAVIRSAVRHSYAGIHLKYSGGEAALQLPQVIATHDYAQEQSQQYKLRLSASILSNGTIMTQHMIDQLKERHIHVMISLDGIGAMHDQQRPYVNGTKGSFAMVDRTISRLLANNLRPTINVTVSQRNIADLPTLLSYILERDLHFTLSYYRENDCSASITDLQFSEKQMIDGMLAAFSYIEDHLPRRRIVDSLIDKGSLRAPHHYTCGVGRNYLVINQRGEVAKCQMDIAQPVTTILADDPLHDIRTARAGMQAVDVDHKEGCRTCTWRYWCGGGCPLVTYRMTGRNDLRSPNCAIYKALYPQAVRLEALRLLKYEAPISLEGPLRR